MKVLSLFDGKVFQILTESDKGIIKSILEDPTRSRLFKIQSKKIEELEKVIKDATAQLDSISRIAAMCPYCGTEIYPTEQYNWSDDYLEQYYDCECLFKNRLAPSEVIFKRVALS